jgi:hypothetical protein
MSAKASPSGGAFRVLRLDFRCEPLVFSPSSPASVSVAPGAASNTTLHQVELIQVARAQDLPGVRMAAPALALAQVKAENSRGAKPATVQIQLEWLERRRTMSMR